MTDRQLMQQALDFICSVMVHPSQIAARDAIADALEKRLAQPEQEPVGWFDKELNTIKWKDGLRNCNLADQQPIYTVPPQRKPLMDEDIADLWSAQIFHITDLKLAKDFVRDIEAAHGIKE